MHQFCNLNVNKSINQNCKNLFITIKSASDNYISLILKCIQNSEKTETFDLWHMQISGSVLYVSIHEYNDYIFLNKKAFLFDLILWWDGNQTESSNLHNINGILLRSKTNIFWWNICWLISLSQHNSKTILILAKKCLRLFLKILRK